MVDYAYKHKTHNVS